MRNATFHTRVTCYLDIEPIFSSRHLVLAVSAILSPTPPQDVYDQSDHYCDEDRLQNKLLSIDLAGHDEERSVGIARKSEKTASPVRRKHQGDQNGDGDG